MRNLSTEQPAILLTALFLVTYFDVTGTVRIGLLAAVLHEIGHVVAWVKMTGKMPKLNISITGIALDTRGTALTAKQELILAAAGPLMNFFMFGICRFYENFHASYWCSWFGASNVLLGLFNLLPIGCLDGRRIVQALFKLCLHLKHK